MGSNFGAFSFFSVFRYKFGAKFTNTADIIILLTWTKFSDNHEIATIR